MVVCLLVTYRAAKALAQLSDVIGGVHLRWDIIEKLRNPPNTQGSHNTALEDLDLICLTFEAYFCGKLIILWPVFEVIVFIGCVQ
jgi:hypothetical protein